MSRSEENKIRATLKKQNPTAESEEKDDVTAKAIEAFEYLMAKDEASAEPEMTLDEIRAARSERKRRAAQ